VQKPASFQTVPRSRGRSAGSPASILVVEDEAIIALAITSTLHDLGYMVSASGGSAQEALAAIEEDPPALVLMDVHLRSELDGIEAAKLIRARFDVPIVYTTSSCDDETLARATETSPHGYLVKPFTPEDLRVAVAVALSRHAAELRLREAAETDELTGLCNRRGFKLLGEQQLRTARRSGLAVTLLFVDVDGMKQVNDELGHEWGDSLLVDAASVLRTTLRDSDIVARLGGDEFVALLLDTDAAKSALVRERLEASLTALNNAVRRPYRLSLSFGAVVASHTSTLKELLSDADQLMYGEKRRRRESAAAPRASLSMPSSARLSVGSDWVEKSPSDV
jgi:two-component system, cell cycle response regulator